MKKILSTLCLLSVVVATVAATKVVEKPLFTTCNTKTLEIAKVTLTDTATILNVNAFFRPNYWIRIASDTYLKVGDKRYALKSAKGIVVDSEHFMPDSGEDAFTLYFEPIPAKSERFDFMEGDCQDCFKIWGVELSESGLPELALDPQFRNWKPDFNAPLAKVVMEAGVVRIKGRMLDWNPSMGEQSLSIYTVLDEEPRSTPLGVKDDGTFDIEFQVPHTIGVKIGANRLFVSPGEVITLNVNQREIARRNSRLHKDSPSMGYTIYSDGVYGALSAEMAAVNVVSLCGDIEDSYKDVLGMDIYQYRDHVLAKTKSVLDKIGKDDQYSDNLKSLLSCYVVDATFNMVYMCEYYLKNAYCEANNISRGEPMPGFKPLDEIKPDYYAFMKEFDLDNSTMYALSDLNSLGGMLSYVLQSFNTTTPFEVIEFLKSRSLLDDKQIALADAFIANPSQKTYEPITKIMEEHKAAIEEFSKSKPKVMMSDLIREDQSILSDLAKMDAVKHNFVTYTPYADDQLKAVTAEFKNSFFANMVSDANDKIISKIEANKSKSGYNIVDMSGVAPEKVLETIIERYKGKVLFIDFWATWCSPCRSAMVQAEPVKAALSGKDVVFIYITSSSPEATWRNMIVDIPGEHIVLTKEQDAYMSKTEYQYNGIPSYAIIGKDGHKKHFQTGFMGAGSMKSMIDKEL